MEKVSEGKMSIDEELALSNEAYKRYTLGLMSPTGLRNLYQDLLFDENVEVCFYIKFVMKERGFNL